MKRKRAKKLLMAKGYSRNQANDLLDSSFLAWKPNGKRRKYHGIPVPNAFLVGFYS